MRSRSARVERRVLDGTTKQAPPARAVAHTPIHYADLLIRIRESGYAMIRAC